MGVILDALAGLGYGVAWRVLDAQHFGVPQRRRRVFLLALPAGHSGAIRAGEILDITGRGGGGDPAGAGAAAGDPPGPTRRADRGRVSHTLTRGSTASGDGAGRSVPIIAGTLDRREGGADDNDARAHHLVPSTVGVRRLMPVECERLMGWPDDWTTPGPDSRRYAACGDGVVAPVAQWIGERLARRLQGGAAR